VGSGRTGHGTDRPENTVAPVASRTAKDTGAVLEQTTVQRFGPCGR
jgi:hypothetical protein